ncbi:glycosyltransferase family 69 [Trichoderma arundinaceum]|uniref:Glycosyltransferase family 69 n=1 Tax=Trichoderma arundinaceum TaxID=490622 RepID=A0A395NP64_TRIAR|nr:glycosyltransferase family 69 [Trichoderma arundinaceum]
MRSRRLPLVAAPFIVLLLLASLYLGRDRLSWFPSSHTHPIPYKQLSKEFVGNGAVLPSKNISEYLEAIYNVKPIAGLPLLECPVLNATRYKSLKSGKSSLRRPAPSSPPPAPPPPPSSSSAPSSSSSSALFATLSTSVSPSTSTSLSLSPSSTAPPSLPPPVPSGPEIRYFFALDLRNCLELLPRLIGSIIEVIQFLGPHSCALSIVEGDSPDGTGDVLAALRHSLEVLGVTYIFNSSTVHSAEGNRIAKLAKLRNMPLEPIFQKTISIAEDASVIFLNDVAACPEDILELILQKQTLNADMTCAMDWTYAGDEPTFYDVWIARGINGDSFFHIPPNGNWGEALNLFWNAPDTKSRFDQLRPFQVFACWNGATVFSAQPILDGLHFRTNYDKKGECFQGEPVLFCKDMWFQGYGKIAVVPSVNLEYSNVNGKRIKELKGFASDIVAHQDPRGDTIQWAGPPDTVRCMPTWKDQFFQRWNKSLTE